MNLDDDAIFMLGFNWFYSSIKKYSDIDDIGYSYIAKKGGKVAKTLSEYFAINGQDKIPTSLLYQTIEITDQFLNTGYFDIDKSNEIIVTIEQNILPTIAEMFKQEHDESQGNDDEMPLVLFVFGYAKMMLKGLKKINNISDYPTRNNRLNLLRESIGKKPKAFPAQKNTP